jgi:hypothetical protein
LNTEFKEVSIILLICLKSFTAPFQIKAKAGQKAKPFIDTTHTSMKSQRKRNRQHANQSAERPIKRLRTLFQAQEFGSFQEWRNEAISNGFTTREDKSRMRTVWEESRTKSHQQVSNGSGSSSSSSSVSIVAHNTITQNSGVTINSSSSVATYPLNSSPGGTSMNHGAAEQDEQDQLSVDVEENTDVVDLITAKFLPLNGRVAQVESTSIEFKESVPPRNLIGVVCNAFLNSPLPEGTLYCGITDKGVIKGVQMTVKKLDQTKAMISNIFASMYVESTFWSVKRIPVQPGSRFVLSVSVKSYAHLRSTVYLPPEQNAYIRGDGTNNLMKGAWIEERLNKFQRLKASSEERESELSRQANKSRAFCCVM